LEQFVLAQLFGRCSEQVAFAEFLFDDGGCRRRHLDQRVLKNGLHVAVVEEGLALLVDGQTIGVELTDAYNQVAHGGQVERKAHGYIQFAD